jgi:Protein of unknown function (DUF2490)
MRDTVMCRSFTWAAGLLLLLGACPARAQTNAQIWGNITVNWVQGEHLTYELDLEPKVLVSAPEGEPEWWNVDVTPNLEFAAASWLDLITEIGTGYTRQTDDENSTELTPRAGVRLHFMSRDRPRRIRIFERPPKRRFVVRDRILVESRNFFYSGTGTGNSSTVRFRNRLEFLVPLNTEKISDDGARYLLSDWEWFIPLDDPAERFANRQRIRAGLGYRHTTEWRFEFLYIWTRSRDTTDEGFRTTDNIINLRVKRVF